jgi:ABC-type antimicrobial peptide transport system permease subunit
LLVGGLAIGIGLALAAGRAASSMLFGLEPSDPVTIGASVAGLTVVAIAASLVPGLRASRVEPIVALREE